MSTNVMKKKKPCVSTVCTGIHMMLSGGGIGKQLPAIFPGMFFFIVLKYAKLIYLLFRK